MPPKRKPRDPDQAFEPPNPDREGLIPDQTEGVPQTPAPLDDVEATELASWIGAAQETAAGPQLEGQGDLFDRGDGAFRSVELENENG